MERLGGAEPRQERLLWCDPTRTSVIPAAGAEMIHETKPGDAANFIAVGCFCVAQHQVLLVRRRRREQLSSRWAIPAGKVEPGESLPAAILRELREEVGIETSEDNLIRINDHFITGNGHSFRFITFALPTLIRPGIYLDRRELCGYDWVDVRQISKRCVMPFFWDGIVDLKAWMADAAVQPRLFPTPPAVSARDWLAE